jgi:hypothetical protein
MSTPTLSPRLILVHRPGAALEAGAEGSAAAAGEAGAEGSEGATAAGEDEAGATEEGGAEGVTAAGEGAEVCASTPTLRPVATRR